MEGIPGFGFGGSFPRPPRPPRPPRTPRTPRTPPTPHGFSFGGFGGFGNRSEGGQPQAKGAAKPGASDEERMTILKMLEEKRITPEQAELLLGALGDE
jgi:hypothetical protein